MRYEHCEWVLFVKNCYPKIREEPRGLSLEEAMTVKMALLNLAHKGAIDTIAL